MKKWYHCLILLTIFFFTFPNEYDAARNNTFQRVRSFHCINNNYIFSNWFCDGINDCADASDESYGCDMPKCGTGNFTCQSDSTCLPISVRCNNLTDCSDGSDEKYCHHEPSLDDCKITKGKFLCNDKLRCIDIGRVCDEESHCFDGSDEGGKCDDYDHVKCTVCPHACFRTPLGPQCFYNPDSATYDEVHKDITFCPAAKNSCDQKCVTYRDINQCSCEENFTPTYTIFSAFYCEEKEKDKNWLIYTINGAVRGIQGYSNQSKVIRETSSAVTAIAAGNEYVYWGRTYENAKVIEKTSLSSSDFAKNNILISEGIDEVNAMDIDWRTGNIYFIDNGKSHIAACRNDGKLCIQVFALDNIATSITLAPREGAMFFSIRDEEYGFVIKKSDMNGQAYYNFIEEGLGDIYSIACDEASERLFWLDASRRRIEMVRFNGEGRKIFKSDLRIDYLSITINARYLYWNVNNSNSNTNPNNPNNIYFSPGTRVQPKIALNGSNPVLLIYGYSYSEKTTKMTSPCDWGCDNGICLMHSLYHNKTGSDCICGNTSEHKTDAWCRNNADHYLGYSYHYDDYYHHHTESPHHPVRIILVVCSIIFIICAISFYLYRKGCFHGVDVFRHARL